MKNLTLSIFTLLVISTTLVSCKPKATANENKETTKTGQYATLKDRSGVLAATEEWKMVKEKYVDLISKIKSNPDDTKSKLFLAQLFMQEARITGEHPYYYPATLVILDDILKKEPKSFEALAFKASVMLSLHHFAEALEIGAKAKEINDNNGFIYGVLVDANVELGQYEEAVRMSDSMQAIRPGLEAYARASYLREIYGKNNDAIDAMKMAYKAGLPGTEEAAWTGYTLACLFENTGDLKNAENLYNEILIARPSYAFAVAGLGRVATARKSYDTALMMLEKAANMMPEYSFYEDMAEVYTAMGNKEKATELNKKIIGMLGEDAAKGHYADMDLALTYLKLGDVENALKHAKTEYDRRPENIDVNSTMAWVLYTKGDYATAQKHIKTAMKTGKQSAVLLCRAGIIEKAAGNAKQGQEWIAKALKINPNLPTELMEKI